MAWSAQAAGRSARTGVFLWSASASRAVIGIELAAAAGRQAAAAGGSRRLEDLRIDGLAAGAADAQVAVGERWSVSLRPWPQPENPDDPGEFALDGLVTAPSGEEWLFLLSDGMNYASRAPRLGSTGRRSFTSGYARSGAHASFAPTFA